MKPIKNNLVIKKEDPPNQSSGGIILVNPDAEAHFGTVVARGVDVDELIEVGSKVLFKKYAATHEVQVNDETLSVLADNDVLCVV